MKKIIFYPDLRKDSNNTVTEDEYEYEKQLFEKFHNQYPSSDVRIISGVIHDKLYAIYSSLEDFKGKALDLISYVKKLIKLPREEIIETAISDKIGSMCLFYKGDEENIRYIIEERNKIPYTEEIRTLVQKITQTIISDIERTTRDQLTFLEKTGKPLPGEKKLTWANRVSTKNYDSSTKTTVKETSEKKSVAFAESAITEKKVRDSKRTREE